MSSFTKDLIPGEEIIAVCKKSWTSIFNKANLIALVVALIFLAFLPLVSLAIVIIMAIPTFLEFKNTELVLTNIRLRGKKGIFNIQTVENKASSFVGNVKTRSNVLLSALGSSTIIIQSSGVGHYVFTHMTNASQISNGLYTLKNNSIIVYHQSLR